MVFGRDTNWFSLEELIYFDNKNKSLAILDKIRSVYIEKEKSSQDTEIRNSKNG